MIVNSLNVLPADVTHTLNVLDTFALTMAMTALGIETRVAQIRAAGPGADDRPDPVRVADRRRLRDHLGRAALAWLSCPPVRAAPTEGRARRSAMLRVVFHRPFQPCSFLLKLRTRAQTLFRLSDAHTMLIWSAIVGVGGALPRWRSAKAST